MSPETRYRIEELEELTGLSRRLIHDYISRELVPAAMGSGKGAYYLEEHYDRLRLISLLRTMGFRLERIEEALKTWEPDEIARIVEFAEGRDMHSLDALNEWLMQPERRPDMTSAEALDRVRRSLHASAAPELRVDMLASAQVAAAPQYRKTERSQTWERVPISPDVEISYRHGIDPEQRRRVTDLIEHVKELFRR